MKRMATLFLEWVGLLLIAGFCIAETVDEQFAPTSARNLKRWTSSAPYSFSGSASSITIMSSPNQLNRT